MSGYRKLGRTSSQRKALLRNQVTNLLYYGRITTTDTKAKEIRKIAERLITLAVKEKDNYETVTVTQKVPKKTADGRRVKNVVDGKKVTEYEEITKTIQKDKPSRLNARRQMLKTFYPIVETPANGQKIRTESKKVDMPAKMFAEIAPKYENRKGGYTRIVKVGPRKGDGAEMVIIELV
ncbi:MAG: 50S ribosomal protein L17 [Firmicutes bacterium]|nr:50S ribosomal protein L17 [Bacillota bacterium]